MPVAENVRIVSDLSAILVVGVGAAIGGILRLLVTTIVVERAGASAAPLATLGINVLGSFLIGVVVGVVQTRADLSPLWRLFFATGILGGFTTFSTFSLDALGLGAQGAMLATGYVVGSVAFAIVSAYAGISIGRAV